MADRCWARRGLPDGEQVSYLELSYDLVLSVRSLGGRWYLTCLSVGLDYSDIEAADQTQAEVEALAKVGNRMEKHKAALDRHVKRWQQGALRG